jgi:hypothetical protein
MEKETALWVVAGLLCILAVLSVIAIVSINDKQTVKVPTAEEIAAKVVLPAPVIQQVNSSGLNNLNKVEDWKLTAKNLAIEDYSEKNYKAIYNYIDDEYSNIEDREDIKSVVLKKTTVTDYDADEQNAEVVQELKVYYEPSDSTDDAKVYLTITTTIEDGEVTDTEIVETA